MSSADLRVLSAGSVEPGLVAAAAAYLHAHGVRVQVEWATTPNIRRRVGAGEVFDLVLLTVDAAADLTASGHLRDEPHVPVGSVGVGVAVRDGAPLPNVDGIEAIRETLIGADAVIFTRATSGIYVEALLKREGLYERLGPKITRFETGPQMMDHLIRGSGNVVCLGAAVELRMFDGKGIRWLGPLPDAWQRRTAYVIARMTRGTNAEAAARFASHLASENGRRMFAECGVDVPVM